MQFNPSKIQANLDSFWSMKSIFGMERSSNHVFLEEVVPQRLSLMRGFQVLRDEFDFSPGATEFSIPGVVTTLAHTTCGDRIHQGSTALKYDAIVGSRFGTLSRAGLVKIEKFSPAGGGTDDGRTLAHVTLAHAIDGRIRQLLHDGNPSSFLLASVDLQTHVGRETGESISFGRARESPWREPRNACGAIIGTLAHYDANNDDHQRIRKDLGEENFALLSKSKVLSDEGVDVTPVVAAAVVAVQGMQNTAEGLKAEMDDRSVAHLTASITVNRVARDDTIIFLAQATVFGGEIKVQGFGTDAKKYGSRFAEHKDEKRLALRYD